MTITGRVIKGDGRGRQLGYPTANIKSQEKVDCPDGIYACFVRIGNKTYQGALFIGVRRMFGYTQASIEIYIFDFNQDIYNQIISVEVKDFIRPNQRFDSIEELKHQIAQDCLVIQDLLK
jgi:riboflavin kinase/FMN adenylyltransferase